MNDNDHENADLPDIDISKNARQARAAEAAAKGNWGYVAPTVVVLLILLPAAYFFPYLVYHWRNISAHADAEAAFMKRRAELRAEAEHGDERIDALDKRVQFRDVVRKVKPVVVHVASFREQADLDLHGIEAKRATVLFDPQSNKHYVQNGVGSGLILRPGVILTNHHVIKTAQKLQLSFASGRSINVDSSAIISDPRSDLAVIKLPENMPAEVKEETKVAAEFADSDKDIEVGDWVLAMGSPLGLQQTVTHGIISAKGRFLNHFDFELLQTDAAINQGNSGGPLFNYRGRVVGINAMIAGEDGLNRGIGFAIPGNIARKVSEQLLTGGEAPRGYLGIGMDEIPAADAKALNIDDGAVLIKLVEPGQPADKAGIHVGDILVRINKEALPRQNTLRHVRQVVGDVAPGAQINIEVLRGDERRHFAVTVGKRPPHLR